MSRILLVGAGGALGAIGRYVLSLLPVRGDFPLITLCTNFLGALLIGFVVGLAGAGKLGGGGTLFWKTGVCGGFTTFSTFSLEAVGLLESGQWLKGGGYVLASVALCLAGVVLGRALVRSLAPA